MKKTIKIMSIVLIAIMLVASISSVALADTVTDVLNDMTNKNTSTNTTDGLTSLGGNIAAIVQVVGIVIAVIVILVIGIKYLVASPEGKAEYKKTMIPYLVGAVLIFAGTTIVNVVYQAVTGLK